MGRYWVMNCCCNTFVSQPRLQPVTFRMANNKKVPYWVRPIGNVRQRHTGQAFKISMGKNLTPGVPFAEVSKFDTEV